MQALKVFRLLLDVYGALFLGVIVGSAAVYGVLPYEAFMSMGALAFYALIAAAFALWIWLAARLLVSPEKRE